MNLLNPGLSVSSRETSASEESAIDTMYSARSRNPRISPAVCDIGLRQARYGLSSSASQESQSSIQLTDPFAKSIPRVFRRSSS